MKLPDWRIIKFYLEDITIIGAIALFWIMYLLVVKTIFIDAYIAR